jgi:diguanylate cyclase (GGDEF)-like protein/PAS domain S-box-containing protein
MAGNILPAALLSETTLMFGSVAVLLVIRFYGTGWGVAAALLAGFHTIALWHHPFVVLIFVAEALVAGLLLKRGFNLVLADAYFWFFISLPLYLVFYCFFMGITPEAAGLALLRQALNGIFNAILALALLRFLPLRRYHKSPLTLWDNWLSIILFSFALPAVLIMIFNGRSFAQLIKPNHEMHLLANCQVVEEKLADSLHQLQQSGEKLARLAGEKGLGNLAPLQSLADSLQQELPPGMQLYISDLNDRIVLSSLPQPTIVNQINPRPDRCSLAERTNLPGYSEVHTDAIMPSPHLSFNIPIVRNGCFTGEVHATLDCTGLAPILGSPPELAAAFTVIDHKGRIFASTDPGKKPMGDFFVGEANKYGIPEINSYLWQPEFKQLLPASSPVAAMHGAGPSHFSATLTPLYLAIDLPWETIATSLHSQYLNSMALMLSPALLALLLGWTLHRRVTSPLNELVVTTRDLTNKHHKGEKISWPVTPGWEVAELTANFRELVSTLDNKDKLLRQWIEENTKSRQKAEQAMDDAHARHKWEVFSTGRKLRAEVDHGERMKELLAELELAEEKYRFLVEKSLVGFYIIRAEKLIYVNPRFAEILLYPHEELLAGIKLNKLVAKDDWLLVRANQLKQLRNEARNLQYQYQVRCKDGTIRHVEVLDGIGSYAGKPAIIGTMLDITERVKAEETIKHMAYHDPLTGLPNRFVFQDRIHQSFSFAARHQKMVGLLFLDLDRFKSINDTLGHMIGDQLLKEVSSRLQKDLRSCDTISRFGGDEFNILVTEVTLESDIQMVAHKIIRSMEYPFYLDGRELYVTCSIGIAIYPRDCQDAENLVKKADTALYRAKEMGRNNFQTYNDAMGSLALERMAMESSLRHALERHEFRVYYQPQVNLISGKVVGVEALVRWKHPSGEIVPPSSFIPLAEEIGFIVPIGEWVLRTACLQAKAWQDEGFAPIRIGVNVSIMQFDMPDFSTLVSEIINEADIGPEWVNLEITESVIVKNAEEAIAKFQELHNVGITIAIDDFGIGYSCLSYLKDFRVDQLKMDRAFVRNLPHEKNDANIAGSIVKMAHDLKMSVIAEGVENEDQFNFLRSLGCNEVQGYIISKPVPAEEVARFFEHPRRPPNLDNRRQIHPPGPPA